VHSSPHAPRPRPRGRLPSLIARPPGISIIGRSCLASPRLPSWWPPCVWRPPCAHGSCLRTLPTLLIKADAIDWSACSLSKRDPASLPSKGCGRRPHASPVRNRGALEGVTGARAGGWSGHYVRGATKSHAGTGAIRNRREGAAAAPTHRGAPSGNPRVADALSYDSKSGAQDSGFGAPNRQRWHPDLLDRRSPSKGMPCGHAVQTRLGRSAVPDNSCYLVQLSWMPSPCKRSGAPGRPYTPEP